MGIINASEAVKRAKESNHLEQCIETAIKQQSEAGKFFVTMELLPEYMAIKLEGLGYRIEQDASGARPSSRIIWEDPDQPRQG